ncbi:DUF5686 family protein [Flavihumibacter petaseus]|uniref:Uncharacterized protein n=1 Tax=Flavihumibacter petaseus NBRC 106054 TaxID=1220578 RepID=A0A0E9MX60_9BACT|nr:DUF5686 family protein [Flavihumibacter petaseus]GAO41705.1 hypothetical protein FPE01S_01_07190 [Flavihumibacter petaseus NBRC 106054]
MGWRLFCKCIILLLLGLLIEHRANAQEKIIRGYVKDKLSDERIPFASLKLKIAQTGSLSDSSGGFIVRVPNWSADTLEITYVGYEDLRIPINPSVISQFSKDGGKSIDLILSMVRGKTTAEVVVKRKIDKGYLMWKRIVKRKPFNDRYRFTAFKYELYNKLELDLNRLKKDRLKDMGLLKPFGFILENIDTTEGQPFLPIYLTETISDYYYQKSPWRTREIIKAVKTIGINNESVSKLLGGTDQNVNVYNNFIPVFDKQFVSPISDNGDAYYHYKVLDSQFVAGRRLIHMSFTPKRKGENTFMGDCWVHDSTWAIQKMTLALSKEANINFVDKLSLIQEYKLVNDSVWFLVKDKFVADIAPIGKSGFGVIGRKTTTYRDIVVNEQYIRDSIARNKVQSEILFAAGAMQKADSFWDGSRHEQLSKNEAAIYAMIDTLQKMPIFKKYVTTINFLATGYRNVGNFEIGPWFNWFTGNSWEGFRMRFDLGTNPRFNKDLYLHGYLAYGFGDKAFKGKVEAKYLFSRSPRSYIHGSYTKDLDNGQVYYDEIGTDNIFALAIRKNKIPLKFMQIQESKLEYFTEWSPGISATFLGVHKVFEPLQNLPPKELFETSNGKGEALTNFELGVRVRFGYNEKFLETNFNRFSLGSPYPIVEFMYARGIPGVFHSNYKYDKVYLSVSDYLKIAPYGSLYYNFFGGGVTGTLPYMMLNVIPGNEIYYYNKYAFNLMARWEYIGDRYAGFNIEHNFGNGLFRFIPLTRKLKFRQFWSAKGITTSISPANKELNFNNPYNNFKDLDGKLYLELGTGVDNIFKVFRLDFVWRVLPQPLPADRVSRFGIFGSFRLAF